MTHEMDEQQQKAFSKMFHPAPTKYYKKLGAYSNHEMVQRPGFKSKTGPWPERFNKLPEGVSAVIVGKPIDIGYSGKKQFNYPTWWPATTQDTLKLFKGYN